MMNYFFQANVIETLKMIEFNVVTIEEKSELNKIEID